jgi:hypothetical protein
MGAHATLSLWLALLPVHGARMGVMHGSLQVQVPSCEVRAIPVLCIQAI